MNQLNIWLCSPDGLTPYYDSRHRTVTNSVRALVYNSLTYMKSNRRNFQSCPADALHGWFIQAFLQRGMDMMF